MIEKLGAHIQSIQAQKFCDVGGGVQGRERPAGAVTGTVTIDAIDDSSRAEKPPRLLLLLRSILRFKLKNRFYP